MKAPAPSYKGLGPASARASRAARGSSKKAGTRCELALRRALWRQGCRFRVHMKTLPGHPDIVFTKAKVVVFCDGDFWHGKDWPARKEKLARGTNPEYWIAKIRRNMQRDLEVSAQLRDAGWIVLRFWESEIRKESDSVCGLIVDILDSMGHRTRSEPAAGLEKPETG